MNEVYPRKKLSGAGALRYLLKGSIWAFALCIFAGVCNTFLNMLVPELISFTIDSVIGNDEIPAAYAGIISVFGGIEYLKSNMWLLAVILVVLALLGASFIYCRQLFNSFANQIFMRRTRNELFSHLQRLPLSWHSARRTGDIIQRCTSDADTISNFVSGQLITLIRIIVLIAFSLVFMFLKNAVLAGVAAAFIRVY